MDAVEAHGTGTTLGDPIEAQALLATYGQEHSADSPLWLGSVKSNIGHTQAAAGVAGVIKMVMAMRHGVLPRTLHVDEPSPHVDWSSGRGRPAHRARRVAGPRRPAAPGRRLLLRHQRHQRARRHRGVRPPPDRHGPSGDAAEPAPAAPDRPLPWTMSAASAAALRAQAGRLRSYAEAHPEASAADIGFSLAATRGLLEHRAVVVGDRP